ncbi:hypothetical protein DPSP01_010403 [Paraphaeosphaeria sporulosa]|uniref:F-box domain-containing protein n=1 Tax=Paraphaeosphaeria sporulosa TaxID=1460663 RepID=A0A177CTA7_9PLEO|nr:uncharacterized protein CC84DRAFT_1256524 [Paraphaeosphaeria sporulosa]OAG10763.1 hypothetical protein CC84DRAFT_1256524 [Paraphaeosphaeria sporulosa]
MDTIGDFQYMSPTDYSKGQVPWSLQPEEFSAIIDTEQERLRECRRTWLQLVDTRIASYDLNGIKQSTQSSPLAKILSTPSNSSASNRVFQTTELLERILRQADSSAHLTALGVFHTWRDVALYIMKPSGAKYDFARPYPCPPVKFGDRVPRHLNWLPATAEELEWVVSDVLLDVIWGAKRGNVFRSVARFEYPNEPNIIETATLVESLWLQTRLPTRSLQ